MGMAGVLPYMATSLSTVYCAWEINHAETTGSGFFMSEYTAEAALHIIEPLQVGYGALVRTLPGAHSACDTYPDETLRSSPSWVPSIGASSGQPTAEPTATLAT